MTDELLSPSIKISPILSRDDDQLKKLFASLVTTNDVANLLEISPTQLTYILWRKPPSRRYSTWQVRKRRGGMREIKAPTKAHKILQQKFCYILSLVSKHRSVCHGFVRNRSILTNARAHLHQRWVLNIDLQDFFPSIHFGRIAGMLRSKPYSLGDKAAIALAQLSTHNGSLPQGAPTSPILSNIICAKLDGELRRFAKLHRCSYTRYVDDLTFSTSRRAFPEEVAINLDSEFKCKPSQGLESIISSNGFKINNDKLRLQNDRSRQIVTGITVNKRPNVPRKYTSQIRAMLHAWEKHGYANALREFRSKYDSKHRPHNNGDDTTFERVIRGKLAFLKQVRGDKDGKYRHLRKWLAELTNEEIMFHDPKEIQKKYDVFICHASEDKKKVVNPLVEALEVAGISTWVDAGQIKWGDNLIDIVSYGLSNSRYVILVLSRFFIDKNWPIAEMNAVISKELRLGVKVVLPLMVGNDQIKNAILDRFPLLGSKLYLNWSQDDVGHIITNLKSLLIDE